MKRRNTLLIVIFLLGVMMAGCVTPKVSADYIQPVEIITSTPTPTEATESTPTPIPTSEPVCVIMPNLVDHTFTEAKELLARFELENHTCLDENGNIISDGEDNYVITEQSIRAGEKIDITSEISMTCKMIRYDLYIDIDFLENFLFDRYDVEFCLDGEVVDDLIHGEVYSRLLNTTVGKHVISFYKDGYRNISWEKEIDLQTDATLSCSLRTHNDSIEVTKLHFEDGIEGSAIEMPDVVGMVLTDAKELLKEDGFRYVSADSADGSWIIMEGNWTVVEQNIPAHMKTDQYTRIELICRKTREMEFSEMTNEKAVDVENTEAEDRDEWKEEVAHQVVYYGNRQGNWYYLLIDYDAGTVSYVTTDSEEVLVGSFESGDLSSGIEVYYPDGDFTEWLQYKYKNDDETLIVFLDGEGWEFTKNA